MLGRLDLADQKIERLAITSENARNRIIASFQQINTQGIDAFINKLNEAKNRIAALGNTKVNIGAGMFSDVGSQAKYAIDEINKVVTSISRIRTATNEAGSAKNPFIDNNLSASIAKLNTEIELAKKNYAELQNRFTHMNQPAGDKTVMTTIQSEAQFLMQYIQLLEQEKKGLIAAKQALDNANKTSQLKDPYKAKVDDLSRESMEAQRYKDSMQAMKEFYTEQDKERKKADKAAENDRKKREKEEKATADRIASYDSKSRRERYKSYTSTYEGAMRTSDKANTLEREIQAVKNLEAARAKLKKTDSDYNQKLNNLNRRILEHNRNIDKATAGSKNLQNQHRSLMDISGQLARRLAMVFSIYQVAGYIKKLIEVRGEFELQQRALQAILQDKDKANEIWQKTVDLAVKSPFRVKELVSYTKQLAAYRVESDKLFETNKMLADISAGLGVDMQRLILAFGQVRSAAYLRGTELRQFTEAGIPILEQLAKYFTEIEGRAVSVGDVFQRISKRMVSFADVEEIFKRMTSEGGTFYRMQEIQASTLKGMWSNLKDSVDLMLDAMGKGGDSTLKTSISFVKQMVDNWRKLKPVIETAGITLMSYFGVKALRAMKKAISSLLTTHPYLALASAIGIVITYIWRARQAQNEFNAAMSEVENENLKSLEENISLYHKLRETINDATKSTAEHEKAYKQLESAFENILPDYLLQKEYVENLSKGYREAENAMMNYYDAKTRADKRSRIEGMYASELDTDTSELISAIRDMIIDSADDGEISESMESKLLSGVSGAVNSTVEKVKAGELGLDKLGDSIWRTLEKYAEYKGNLSFTVSEVGLNAANYSEQIADITETLSEFSTAIKDIQGLPYETYAQEQASKWLNNEKKKIEQIREIYKKILSLASEFSKADQSKKSSIVSDINLVMSQVPQELKAYIPHLRASVEEVRSAAEKGAFEFAASMQTLEKNFVAGIDAIIHDSELYAEGFLDAEDLDMVTPLRRMSLNLREVIEKESKSLDMTPFQEAVIGGAKEIAERFGQDVNIFEKFIPKQKEALTNVRQEVKAQIESYETQIKEMQISLTQNMRLLSLDVLDQTNESIARMTAELPALKAFYAFLGEKEKEKKGGSDKRMQELKNQISLIKEMNSEYEKLIENMTEEEAKLEVINSYRESLKAVGLEKLGFNIEEMDFTDLGTIDSLEKLLGEPKYKANKYAMEIQKALDNIRVELKVEAKIKKREELAKDIEELFDRLELTKELKKLGIGKELGEELFKFETIDTKGVRATLEALKPQFEALGKNGVKAYEDALKKINDIEDKDTKERMKTYTKYLLEGMSERVKLKIEEMRKLKEIEESKEFTPEQKERIKKGVSEEARKEQQKQEWKDFKESDMYTMMFEDLEHYGTEAINMLYTKLSDLKKSLTELPANEVKEIVQQIEKLENIKIERNPFKELVKYSREVKKIGFSEEELQGQLRGLQEREAYAQRIIDVIHLMEQAQTDGMSQADALAQLTPEQVRDWQVAVDLQKQLGGEMGDVVKNQENIVKRSKESQVIVKGQISSYKRLSKAQEESFSKIETWLQSVDDLFSSAKELMTALGVESDSVAMTIADTGSSMVSLILSAVQFTAQMQLLGVASNMALGVIGWIAIALQAVATLLTAIFSAKDNQLKKQVEAHQRTVENLMERYEELSDKIDKAWNTESIRQYNSEMQQTMSLAMNAQKAAIAAQEQRKGANKEGSENWEELQDMKDELKDMEEQLAESLEESFSKITDGILDDVHGAAKEFTDAWYEAFKETGDGLSGLEENFTEMFLSLAKNQAAMQITGAFVDEWKRDLKQYLNDTDTRLTPEEARAWADEVKATMPELSAALEAFLGTIHEGLDGGASGLSALQKGISGMSEQQAEILTAYWNSVRGYTASIDSKMNLVLENLGTGAEDNPMLEQMRLVAKNTSAINTLLSSLVKGGHPQGGQGLKVFMD